MLLLGAGGTMLLALVGAGVELLLEAGGISLVADVVAGPLLELVDGIGSLLDETGTGLVGAITEELTPAEDKEISDVKELELFFLCFFFGALVQPLTVRASKLIKIPVAFFRIWLLYTNLLFYKTNLYEFDIEVIKKPSIDGHFMYLIT